MESIIRKNTRYKILGPNGFSNFSGISKTKKEESVLIKTINSELRCSFKHLLPTKNGLKQAIDIDTNDQIIVHKKFENIISIEIKEGGYFYDALDVEDNNLYYTNNILSHNCEFLGSSGTLISGAALKMIEENIRNTRPLSVQNDLYVYEMPVRYHRYITVVDVSRGKGLDYSTFSVIDVTEMPWKQVCVYRSNLIQTYDFAEILFQVLKRYNNSYVLVEINDNGSQVPDLLHHNYEYENIISTAGTGKNGKKVSFGWGRNFDRGLRTTKVSKSVGCSMLKSIIEQGKLIINDKETYNELTTFSMKSNGTFAAEEGRHDDLVMPLVIFGWLTDDAFFEEYTNSKTLERIRDKTSEEIDTAMSFFVLTGDEIIEPDEPFNNSFDRFLFNSV